MWKQKGIESRHRVGEGTYDLPGICIVHGSNLHRLRKLAGEVADGGPAGHNEVPWVEVSVDVTAEDIHSSESIICKSRKVSSVTLAYGCEEKVIVSAVQREPDVNRGAPLSAGIEV